jgi:hypothetical protein
VRLGQARQAQQHVQLLALMTFCGEFHHISLGQMKIFDKLLVL